MPEHYMFFDSENPLQPDRTYNAQEFTDYFKALITTGIMKGTMNQLQVSANGSTMISTIDTGIAFLLGRYYENDSLLALTHETEAIGKNRIDRIVIRMDLGTNARNVKAFVKKGVASTTPVAPALTQTSNLYEISLAQVLIEGGQTFIDSISVMDERGTDVICPWAGSRILPNFDDFTLEELMNKVNSIFPEPWKEATLQNGWSGSLKYRKNGNNHLDISLRVTIGSVDPELSVAQLPVGYRPGLDSIGRIEVLFEYNSGMPEGTLYINSEGIIRIAKNSQFAVGNELIGVAVIPI